MFFGCRASEKVRGSTAFCLAGHTKRGCCKTFCLQQPRGLWEKGSGLGALAQGNVQGHELAAAVYLDLHHVARVEVFQGVGHVAGALDQLAAHADDAVAHLHARLVGPRAAGNALHVHAKAAHAVLHGGLRVRDGDDRDAQGGPAGHVAVFNQVLRHLFCGVDGNGEAQALGVLAGGFGVHDADQLAVCIKQAAAGVAGAHGRAGLHEAHGVALHGDLAVQAGNDAVGGGVAEGAQGVAHRNGQFAHLHAVGIAQHRGGQAGGINLQHRDVALAVCADELGGVFGVVRELDLDLLGALDHVVVCDDVAVGSKDHAAARAADHLLAAPEVAGDHLLGGDRHHAGVHGVDHAHQVGGGGAGAGGRGGGGSLVHDAVGLAGAGRLKARVAAAEAHACNQNQSQRPGNDLFAPAFFLAGRFGAQGALLAHFGGEGLIGAGSRGIAVVIQAGIIVFPLVFHALSSFLYAKGPGAPLRPRLQALCFCSEASIPFNREKPFMAG